MLNSYSLAVTETVLRLWYFKKSDITVIESSSRALISLTSLKNASNSRCKLLLTVELLRFYLCFIALLVDDTVQEVFYYYGRPLSNSKRPLCFSSSCFFPNTLSPPSLNRFRRNFPTQLRIAGNRKPFLYILLRAPKRNWETKTPFLWFLPDTKSRFCNVIP